MSVLQAGHKIIVIGASAGGLEAIKGLVSKLPRHFNSPIFIVWHMGPGTTGILPQVINNLNTVPAVHAVDKEPIEPGKIYIAPPDRHLLIEKDRVRVTHGPRENRFRPAVDPLFRSAAYAYGARVAGIVLSGALDDGTAGLWTIKRRGGMAIVQEPADAAYASMPTNALEAVNIDFQLPIAEIAQLLIKLDNGLSYKINTTMPDPDEQEDNRTKMEISVGLQENTSDASILELGEISPYTCPECHGVLVAINEGRRTRFRCHTGHAFSADSLLLNLTESIEKSLWSAVRGLEETVFLLNNMGDQFSSHNNPKLAAAYFRKAKETEARADKVRAVIKQHELLSTENTGTVSVNQALAVNKKNNHPA